MSIRLGNGTLIAGGAQTFPLLSTMWADHILNDVSWLRADTFSWQSGDVYKSVYEKLVAEYATGTTETEGAITFKRTESGFKIADSTQEQAILDLYNSTGVAWYYILDTTNKRFKLPRAINKSLSRNINDSMPDYSRSVVVNYNTEFTAPTNGWISYSPDTNTWTGTSINIGVTGYIAIDGKTVLISSYVQNSDSSHPDTGFFPISAKGKAFHNMSAGTVYFYPCLENKDTDKHLYFFVGNYVQNQTAIDIGQMSEQLNGKVDLDMHNSQKPYIVETYNDGNGNWYRVWSDKWCEQGGRGTNTSGAGFQTITLLKEMRDTKYTLLNCNNSAGQRGDQRDAYVISTTQIGLGWDVTQAGGAIWKVEGYIL